MTITHSAIDPNVMIGKSRMRPTCQGPGYRSASPRFRAARPRPPRRFLGAR
ncbi:hypothetical protein GLE_1417 [Lysobacter enzymogenes]|uniref:Uncharacterized protein n=1 Tax=Lysobacter enzymogenes TaxID=69 RepID=A0A0S2DDS8_LYSEN|nr:hypothetical protein GLE_1417 [Lysobacter enzymogenes]